MVDPQPKLTRSRLWWMVVIAWWTASGLVNATQYQLMLSSGSHGVGWGQALATSMTSAYLWVPFTMMALWLSLRVPIERGSWLTAVAVHSVAAVFVLVARAVAVVVANPVVGWYEHVPSFDRVLLQSFVNNFLLYWMLVGVSHAVHYARQSRSRAEAAQRLKTELAEAQLAALKAQLHPHFLFNTLHSLSELVHEDVDTADRMIVRLSELLRYVLDRSEQQWASLDDEVRFLEAYVELESMRFGDRISVRWSIADDTRRAQVPALLLQPLVENALRHGLGPRSGPGVLELTVGATDGRLVMTVRDDGVGFDGTASARGIGLANTRARLERLYGDASALDIAGAPGQGTTVTVSVPLTARSET